MATLMNWLLHRNEEEYEVRKALKRLDKQKTSIQVEVENTQVRFRTVLAIKREMVVVARPRRLPPGLRKGGGVRFKDPADAEREIRMEVIHPHFLLTSGNRVMLCKLPEAYYSGTTRNAFRFATERFRGLTLTLPEIDNPYQVLDLSPDGCRLAVYDQNKMVNFPIEEAIQGVQLHVGKNIVELDWLEPRVHLDNSVGCEMRVASGGSSRQTLAHLLDFIDKSEQKQFTTITDI